MNIVTLFGKSIVTLFGKSIYANKLEIDAGEIVSMIDNPRKPFEPKIGGGYRFAKEGSGSLHILDEDRFKFLKDIILNEFHSYIYDGMRYTNKFRITTSWFIQIVKDEGAQLHNHLNCFISGVLYLQTNLSLFNPVVTMFHQSQHSININSVIC